VRVTLLAVVATIACSTGHDHPLPSGPPPADTQPVLALAPVAGDSQVGTVGAPLPTPLEVAVRDTAGHGVAGVLVQFAVVGANARLTPVSGTVRTGSDGHAKVIVTLGRRAEAVRVVAASAEAFGAAAFDLTATRSSALMVVPISGDSQIVALPGANLEPFVVAVRDTFGNRVSVRPVVVFRVASGGATFGGQDSTAVVADSAGMAGATLTSSAPGDGDTVRVIASVAGMAKPPLPAIAVGLAFRGKTWGAKYLRVCALGMGGAAYCWGSGSQGALGTGDSANRSAPTLVTMAPGFLAVDAGGSAGCGLMETGATRCWGSSAYGGTGGGDVAFRSISVGGYSACGVSGSGAAHCWGYGTSPVVPSPVRFTQVSVGSSVTCALTAEGRAYCWGSNSYGQLGSGYLTYSSAEALPVAGGLTFRSLSAGGYHVCGLTTAGTAYCWGYNYHGQLGNGASADAPMPAPVAGGLTFADISAGAYHTCGVTPAGAAYCWGLNSEGQLGTGTLVNSRVPVPVAGGIIFATISAGDDFTCGVTPSGAMYCWGSNGSGQLGTGTIGGPAVSIPTSVTGGLLFQPAPPAVSPRRGPARRIGGRHPASSASPRHQ
jgi:alpha-tubulin suppressor-like RCC1 family protein